MEFNAELFWTVTSLQGISDLETSRGKGYKEYHGHKVISCQRDMVGKGIEQLVHLPALQDQTEIRASGM